ncbi:MAG: lipoyl(octanoyl) transferase LipB [Longimicrobiales bacterium]
MTPPDQSVAGSESRVPSHPTATSPGSSVSPIAGTTAAAWETDQPLDGAWSAAPGACADITTPRGEPNARARVVEWRWLGTVPYGQGLALQTDAVAARRAGTIPDQLLLLEHPHVITLGTSSRPDHVLVSDHERLLLDIERFETGRGGDVTYHGPGQLVGYPILDLKPDRCDLHRYVRDLEEVLIRALADLGITAGRVAGLTGAWVGDKKIAAIGVRVSSGWITSHGFALNVSTDLRYFDAIVPCGVHDRGVTSIERVLGRRLPMNGVVRSITERFAEVFGRCVSENPA